MKCLQKICHEHQLYELLPPELTDSTAQHVEDFWICFESVEDSMEMVRQYNGCSRKSVHICCLKTITCLKLTIETLKQGVKYVQSYNIVNIFHTLL